MKSTWEWLCVDSGWRGSEEEEEEGGPEEAPEVDHSSLNTSTPSMILELWGDRQVHGWDIGL